ncbi:MAG: putative PEP-binding protein [Pseudomonadota bacterium]|nr:putative PEP-binding protein [Pseudomonadota bacterium]
MNRALGEMRLEGVPLSPGVALGRGCFFQREVSSFGTTAAGDGVREAHRLNETLAWMIQRQEALARDAEARLGPREAEIFYTYQMILEDGTFQQGLFDAVERKGLTAAGAIERQLDLYKAQLQAADSEYLRQRVADIAEIQRGLLARLCREVPCLRCKDKGITCDIGQCLLGNDHVLVARELTASLPMEMDSHNVGFLVEKGGRNSHAAILARAMQVPAVSGIRNLSASVPFEARILIDGDTGEVFLNPSSQTLARYQSALDAGGPTLQILDPVPELRVMANIERAVDVQEALAVKAEGIGLYRTEVEALAEGRLLSETEQEARYSKVVGAMAGKGAVCIRLLDLGADKTAAWLGTLSEDGSMPECRGTRLLLARPELLRDQARALARAAIHRPIHVMYPMIVDVVQFRRVRALFDEAVAGLNPHMLLHGVLFEVPSACLQAPQILREADFGCIGTNDLIQCLFAADRTSEAEDFEDNPVLWRLIEDLCEAAREVGKPMSICGELAGNPNFTRRIMKAGIAAVSTSTTRIGEVRRSARHHLS